MRCGQDGTILKHRQGLKEVSDMTNKDMKAILTALSSYRRKLIDQSVVFLRAGNHEEAKASTLEAANVNALVLKVSKEIAI